MKLTAKLQTLLAMTTVLLSAFFGLSVSARAQSKKPHIVYIVSDDQGWKDVGFHGSDIKTPNLDALAAGGTRLEQYCAQPMCTPTRAALMTGRYPLRFGLQTAVIASGHPYGLPTDEFDLSPDAAGTDHHSKPHSCSHSPHSVQFRHVFIYRC